MQLWARLVHPLNFSNCTIGTATYGSGRQQSVVVCIQFLYVQTVPLQIWLALLAIVVVLLLLVLVIRNN